MRAIPRARGRYVATPPFVERTYAEPDPDPLLAAMRIAAGQLRPTRKSGGLI